MENKELEIDDIFNEIQKTENQEVKSESDKKIETDNEKKEFEKSDNQEVKQDKKMKLSDIVDINTVAKISSGLLNWFNYSVLIGTHNKLFGKMDSFNAKKYSQSKDEITENQEIIKDLLKNMEFDNKTIVRFLFIIAFAKNFETPYQLYISDLKASNKVTEEQKNIINISKKTPKNEEDKKNKSGKTTK